MTSQALIFKWEKFNQLPTFFCSSDILIMFNFRQKDQFDFGSVSINDDRDIEIHQFKRESKKGLWFESVRLLRDIILIIAVFVLFGVFVAQPVVVEGTSMAPELHNGERLLVNKLVYYNIESFSWGHIERGDIVVFWYPLGLGGEFLKRALLPQTVTRPSHAWREQANTPPPHTHQYVAAEI